MPFETTEIFKAITDKTLSTPARTLAVINSGKEDVNTSSENNETYLHVISQNFISDDDAPALIPVVFQLSNAGIDVNAEDADGNNALHVAVMSPNARILIRALIMIGLDPLATNNEEKTPFKIGNAFPENLKILKALSPGLWNAVEQNCETNVKLLTSSWCKINETRNGVSLIQLADKAENKNIKKILLLEEKTIKFVHYGLAADRKQMRQFFNRKDTDINTLSTSYIDKDSGDLVCLPLIGEVALLGLTAVLRKLLRKKASLTFEVKKTPLFLYILQNILIHDNFYEMVEIMMDKIDFIKNRSDTIKVLDAAYDKKLPIKVLRTMAANGLDLFSTDENGHFLRDRILIKNAKESPRKIEMEIAYVDNILIDMASSGCIDSLQELVERCYEYIDVTSTEGDSIKSILSKTIGESKAEHFLKEAFNVQRSFRQVSQVIKIGHLAQAESLLTPQVLKVKDRFGRSLAHRAVLYERRHVLRHLIKVKPDLVSCVDQAGRSPLYYACALEEGDDLVDALKVLGCKMDSKDQDGITPLEIKVMSLKEKNAWLTKERNADYGIDTFLFFKYLDIKEAIRAGNFERVEEIRQEIYKDISTEDIASKMYQTIPPQKDILQFAMDARRDKIAKYLLTSGMNWNVKYRDGKEELSLLEAAKRKDMQAVVGYIDHQIKKDEQHKALISKLKSKGVVKKAKNIRSTTSNDETEQGENIQTTEENIDSAVNSKSCVLQ